MAENVKLYMKLFGPGGTAIDGECEIAGHEGEIELDDWRWSLDNEKDKNSAELKPAPKPFAFSKLMCRATPAMLRSLATLGGQGGTGDTVTGAAPMKAVILVEDHGESGHGARGLFSMEITLERVFVTEYRVRLRTQDKGGSVEEDWVFDYETMRIDYESAFHEGATTFTLRRPPGSPTQAPSKTRQQIVQLAEGLGTDDSERLWLYIRDELDRSRFSPALADVLARIDGTKD